MPKIGNITVIILLTLALLVGSAIPVLAAPPKPEKSPRPETNPPARLYKGTVTARDASSFTIKTDNKEVKIRVNEGTRYFKTTVPEKLAEIQQKLSQIPGQAREKIKDLTPKLKIFGKEILPGPENKPKPPVTPPATNQAADDDKIKNLPGDLTWLRQFGVEVTFNDLAVGNRVAVWTAANENEPLAKLVLVIAPKPPTTTKKVTGIITAVDEANQTFTLKPASGDPMTFKYDQESTFTIRGSPSLKVGMKANVVYVEESAGLKVRQVTAGP